MFAGIEEDNAEGAIEPGLVVIQRRIKNVISDGIATSPPTKGKKEWENIKKKRKRFRLRKVRFS